MPRVYRSAELSPDRKYRRRLDRWWAEGPRVAWLMCNPSLADEVRDDPTVRKCVGFTMRWGFPGLTIINPFDLVCTNPADLVLSQYPATLQNGIAIGKVARAARLRPVPKREGSSPRSGQPRPLSPLGSYSRPRSEWKTAPRPETAPPSASGCRYRPVRCH